MTEDSIKILAIRREAEKISEQEREKFSPAEETDKNTDSTPKFSRQDLLERIEATSDFDELTGPIARGEVYADSESNQLVAAMEQTDMRIKFCLISSKDPPTLSKAYSLGDDGELIKASGGHLVNGLAEVQEVDVQEFTERLPRLTPAQAVTYGVPRHERARIATQGKATEHAGYCMWC